MEDDSEVLDWGHEEEDCVAVHGSEHRTLPVDDAEDAVSLGGDEEDEFLTYQSRVPQDTAHRTHSPPRSARYTRQESIKSRSNSPRPHQSRDQSNERGDQSSLPGRNSLGTLVHALPPKPVVSNVPFVHPSHPSIIEATAMASRADRDKRNGTGSKIGAYDHNDSLPPGWEVKHPRSGRGIYYYNIHTQESTWIRPTTPTAREKRGERSDRRDDPLDKPLSTRNETLVPRVGRAESGDMSYDDRHYRPGESGRREERPALPSQLIDSYIPDSYSPNPRNSRTSPPPRAREREPTPPPRRPLSSAGSYGDNDGVQSSHREAPSLAALSAQDRVWVARDSVPHGRPRERRQRDEPTPPETDRRNLPRDTERSSTLRPMSPASYTRGSQESANAGPHSSIKPTQSLSEAPAGRKGRFSQADGPVQHSYGQSESWRARADDVTSHSARYADDIPSSRPMSDVRGDDIPTYPTSDTQRPGSRRRTALPPQDEVFRPAARPGPALRGGSYPLGPAGAASASVPENRHISRIVPDDTARDPARRSPSPQPQPGPFLAERDDRGRSRWSKQRANGSLQMDSLTTHESSGGRAHDTTIDVDDAPLTRLSDGSTKQIPPKRLTLQDEVPRYPRAMLNSDNDGPTRGARESRDGIDSRHRFTADDSSRFGTSRDRPGVERHFADQISQKEPNRGTETKVLPSGSNVKLSGTNNIPIGSRNKFTGNSLHGPMPLASTRRASTVTSGSNGEPVAPRRDRVNRDHERPPLLLDGTTGDRGALTEATGRHDSCRSPLNNNPQILSQSEPATLSTRPSRAALGISRFGPPIVKEDTEPDLPQKSISSESLISEKVIEGSTRATPPPPSRESSMTSFKDVALPPGRPFHLPPRPASPPRGYRYHPGDATKPYSHPNAQSPGDHDTRGNDITVEAPALTGPPSPPHRKRPIDIHSSEPAPVPRDTRGMHSPELPRTSLRDPDATHDILPPTVVVPIVQNEDRERGLPPMHPDRALMLQANGLPPRPLSVLAGGRGVKGQKRDRREDRDRAEPLRGNSRGRNRSASSGGERRRYPEDYTGGGSGGGGGGGASLLDRLSLNDGSRINSPSLRERVQLPSKREREEMLGDLAVDVEGEDYDGIKRVRRRGAKTRKGRI